MNKLEKLNRKRELLNEELFALSFERKDISQRSGKWYSTKKPYLKDVIVIKTISRTKYLCTYVCVSLEHQFKVTLLRTLELEFDIEYTKNFQKEHLKNAKAMVQRDIENGTILTNYAKRFIQGHKNIYYAHPEYMHWDYNKVSSMVNTAKNWKAALKLNRLLDGAVEKVSEMKKEQEIKSEIDSLLNDILGGIKSL